MTSDFGSMRWGRRACVILALASLLLSGCETTPTRPSVGSVEVAEVRPKTSDGWTLELKHYRLKDLPGDRLPIILCHGRTSNGRYWDLTEELSFARYLAVRGYDVWVPCLRGAGTSTKPGFMVLREMMRLKMDNSDQFLNVPTITDPTKFNWTFDDYAFKDVPAIIDAVKAGSGKSRVIWVGHSMGGMILYPYLEHARRADVAAFVALASPIYMPQPPNDLYRLLVNNPQLFQLSTALVNNQLPAAMSALTGREPQGAFFYSPANINKDVVKKYLTEVTEDTTTGVTAQMLVMLRTGDMKSVDEKVDYTADLPMVNVPILLIAGKSDNMCEPACVRYVYEHVSSTDKTYREFGLANGFKSDYGHLDIILGKRSPDEVFPMLLAWISQHDRP